MLSFAASVEKKGVIEKSDDKLMAQWMVAVLISIRENTLSRCYAVNIAYRSVKTHKVLRMLPQYFDDSTISGRQNKIILIVEKIYAAFLIYLVKIPLRFCSILRTFGFYASSEKKLRLFKNINLISPLKTKAKEFTI